MSILFVGDSIALKLATLFGGDALSMCFVGGTAEYIERRISNWQGECAVIAAGSNDRLASGVTLFNLRAKLSVRRAIWVLPFAAHNAKVVRLVAMDWKDRTVAFAMSSDGMHPNHYDSLKEAIERNLPC